MRAPSASAALLVDRFVSASSADDAQKSLEALLDGLREQTVSPQIIWDDAALLEALLEVLVSGKYKNVPFEEGPALVCRLYLQLWKQAPTDAVVLLKKPPGQLTTSLLDVACNDEINDYTRVLALQVLNQVCTHAPSLAQSQLLESPNGLSRLADLFGSKHDSVLNEFLGHASQIIASWPVCAKNWVLASSVHEQLLKIAVHQGGLSGSVVVMDCLTLVEKLMGDASIIDLFWSSSILTNNLALLLDLRGGSEFKNPPLAVSQTDDLEDIIATSNKEKRAPIPKLTTSEEKIITKVLDILGCMLQDESTRISAWKQHSTLNTLVWDLCLLPPPTDKPVCAMPSPQLQQVGLEFIGQYMNDPDTMERLAGVDRLAYFVCTGGANATTTVELERMSQAALFVLRKTLSPEKATDVLLHTMAPPTTSDLPPAPTVVQKLLNTVLENLTLTESKRRHIHLLGSLGALGVFLTSLANREVLLKITSQKLVEDILQSLPELDDPKIQLALLRFVSEWSVETPTVVQAFLESPHSIVTFTALLKSSQKSVRSMTGFVLGLFMESMNDEKQFGGWTRQGIVDLVSQNGGIAGFLRELVAFQDLEDLPWSVCKYELQLFLKWYSAQVHGIRGLVLKELSGSSQTEDNDETKQLKQVVTSQEGELQELRTKVKNAQATIASQEEQLAVWKRRVESTPTQLDDLLTEFTNQNANLEKKVASLKHQLEQEQESFQAQLQGRQDEVEKLTEQVKECQEREAEVSEERNRLREEMQGLSSAYTTLEEEYNRSTTTAGQQQPQGEGSQQEPNNEVATLRADNARLRTEAQAADEWMSTAFQRMKDVNAENQALQQEVAALKEQAQLSTRGTSGVSSDTAQLAFLEERERRQEFETRLTEATDRNTGLQGEIEKLRRQLETSSKDNQEMKRRLEEGQDETTRLREEIAVLRANASGGAVAEELQRRLQEEEGRRQALESELATMKSASDSAEISTSEKEEAVANLENELSSARSQISTMQQEHLESEALSKRKAEEAAVALEECRAVIASKDVELESLNARLAIADEEIATLKVELSQSVAASQQADAAELASLQDRVQSLTEDLERTANELSQTQVREREEMQRRDMRIHELESILAQGGSGAAGFIDTNALREENEQLKAANEAAQDWMGKAVEHHQMLSAQVATLTEEKLALSRELDELKESAASAGNEAAIATIDELKKDLAERTQEVTEMRTRTLSLESEIRIKETELSNSLEKASLCDQLRAELQSAEDDKIAALEKTRSIEGQVEQLLSEKAQFEVQLENLQQELGEKERATVERGEGHETMVSLSAEIESLKALLLEKDEEIHRLRDELEGAKDAFADADQLRITLQNVRDESAKLRVELDSAQADARSAAGQVAQLQQELEEKDNLILAHAQESETTASLSSEIESMKTILLEKDEEIQRVRDELEDAKDAFADADQLRISLQNSQDESSKMRSELDSTRDDVAFLRKKAAAADQLEAQLQDMKDTVAQLERDREDEKSLLERYRGDLDNSERDRESLTTERDSQAETIVALQTRLNEFQTWADSAQEKLTELMSEKESLEQRLNSITDADKDTVDELNACREELAAKSSELSEALRESTELAATKTELASELEKLQLDSANLHGKNKSLEQDLKVLETQYNELLERSIEAETTAKEKEEALRAVELRAESLQADLEAMQEQSSADEWKVRAEEAESTIAELEEALEKHQAEAGDIVEQWSARYSELQALYNEIETNLETVSREREELSEMLAERDASEKDALTELENKHSEDKSDWEAERVQLLTQIDEQQATLSASSQSFDAAQQELSQLKVQASITEETWSDRVANLEATLQEREQELSQHQEEATEAVSRWETHCAALEEKAAQLETELRKVTAQREESSNLESSMNLLREQLEEEKDNREKLEQSNDLLLRQIEENESLSNDIVNQWKEKVQELQHSISETEERLESQLESQQNEAMLAITEWESRCSTLEERVGELQSELDASTATIITALQSEIESQTSLLARSCAKLGREPPVRETRRQVDMSASSIATLQAELEVTKRELADAVESLIAGERSSGEVVQKLNQELEQRRQESEALNQEIMNLKEHMADHNVIHSRVHDLEQTLEGERERLSATQSSLECKNDLVKELEEELRKLREEMEGESLQIHAAVAAERAARDLAEKELAALQETVTELETSLADVCARQEEAKGSPEDLEELQNRLEEKESQLSREREEHLKETQLVIQERDDLKASVGQLEEELRDASDALQACITDEISDRATEIATQALRFEMESMRSQIEANQDALEAEKMARWAAEREAQQLKADLAAVLGIEEGQEDASSEVQRRAMKACEEMQRQERQEMDELRKALDRALHALSTAQAGEREASDTAAAARLQLSLSEQEVVTAKSDIAFLTQALEETREADASKTASLEYRISSLEDDREVLRRFHADEVENLRNELTHVNMEKDRILHSLKESEKKNAAIVYSTSKKRESERTDSPEAEIGRLQVEKAQLLAAAAEEASRTERRLREAVAAHRSSMEADLILERELRAAAEAAVEDIKVQMEELKYQKDSDKTSVGTKAKADQDHAILEQLGKELKRCKEENKTLSSDNDMLRNELEKVNQESKADIQELTEKWRKAQARARKLESEGLFDAQVNAQVAMLRAHENENGHGSNSPNGVGTPLSAVDTYDLVLEQKNAIQEERVMYLELLAEHDDLLALLAQQELVKTSLNNALAQVAGPEAVEAALHDAEERATRQYGKYVRLTT